MATFTTEVPTSPAGNKSKRGTDTLEAEAVGLDVSVRIHGSQVAAVVLDTTEHVEPFEEDTSTMIVFPRGAVVKLRARVRTGHAVVLTNLASKQTALCRIVQVNSTMNVTNYVKLEFIQPAPSFWPVHFPSETNGPTAAEHRGQAPRGEEMAKPAAPVAPTKSAPPANIPAAAQPMPRVDAPPAVAKPLAREPAKESLKPVPAPLNYGISEETRKDEVVPLAVAPPKRAPIAPKPQAIVAPLPPPPPAAVKPPTEAPIFDSLSTGEEVFGKEAAATTTEETAILKSNQRAAQAFVRSLDPSSLLHAGEAPKRHTAVKVVLSVAAVAALAAGAVFYMRQYRGNARPSSTVAAPARLPQTSATVTSTTPPAQSAVEPTPTTPEAPPPSPTEGKSVVKRAPIGAAPPQRAIAVTPVHNSAKTLAAENHPTISNGMASIYAGDLAARPEATQRNSVAVNAPLPAIDSTPKDVPGSSANAGLGSLVGGASSSLPAPERPVEPAPLVRGGQVTPPRLLRSVQPTYPAMAHSNHIEGDVVVQAVIDQTGKVASAKAISGPVILRNAALDAVRQWRYSPATLDGKPITMEYKVTVRFRLDE
jgi:TonB family protein